MISHKYKCIFVEVPKTGTTSIRSIIGAPPWPHLNICQLRNEMVRENLRYGAGLEGRLGRFHKQRSAEGRRQFDEYFKFGFVRNPWDRAVSLYLREEGLQLRETMTFEQFVDWIRYSSSTCMLALPHVNQLDWFVDPHGNSLVDFIGKFENLQEDWKKIAEKIGANPVIPHKNVNSRRPKRHYSTYYTPETVKIIAEKFKTDIQHFGYKFEEA